VLLLLLTLQEGYGFEPRSPFYLWRAWAAAALPLEQAQALVAMEAVMSDDTQRAALLKQAQHVSMQRIVVMLLFCHQGASDGYPTRCCKWA
jgi:hypothetical protein